jgi:hypothetical protein
MKHVGLRLVISDGPGGSQESQVLEDNCAPVFNRGRFLAEATVIEAWYGRNPYSDFLRKYGRRPHPNQAATMGRLIGASVKASDGTMQPKGTSFQRTQLKEARQDVLAAAEIELNIQRLRAAVALAENTTDPREIIDALCPHLDEPEIRPNLNRALQWLSRFAEEWQSREKGRAD